MKTGDDTRRKILERRAAFVAAALSSVCATGCQEKPLACLTPVANEYHDARMTPAVDARAPDASPGMVPPEVCLSVALPPDAGPGPCLKMLPPPRDAGATPCLEVMPSPDAAATTAKPPAPKPDPMVCLYLVAPDD
ncbi:MAG: hypothetical protein HYV09_21275 [Deltaproteobacteria bacterium]|nr:hypothetical protein [Deltaproteobacteria bacterium]